MVLFFIEGTLVRSMPSVYKLSLAYLDGWPAGMQTFDPGTRTDGEFFGSRLAKHAY